MAKKILLADDSITIQKVVELTFSDGDYQIISASNGAKAIQKLSEFRPDIILSDIIMPEKNGYEVCEYVKSHPDFRSIPVILLTGTFEPFDPDRAEKAGCDAIVTKPFESQSLIHKVDELIRLSEEKNRQSAASVEAAERSASGPAVAEASPTAAENTEPFPSPAGFSPPRLQQTDQTAPVESDEAVFPQSDDSSGSPAPPDSTMPWQVPSFDNESQSPEASGLKSSDDGDSPFAAGGWRPESSLPSTFDTSAAPALELAGPESIDLNAQSSSASTSFDNESVSADSQSEPRWQLESPDISGAGDQQFSGTEGNNFRSEASVPDQPQTSDHGEQWGPAAVADEPPAVAEEEPDDISGGRTLPFPRFGNLWQEREEETSAPVSSASPADEPPAENAEGPAGEADLWTAETTQWPATESVPAVKSAEPSDSAGVTAREADEAAGEPVPFPVPPTFSSAQTVVSDESGWALSSANSANDDSAAVEEAAVQSAPSMDMFSPAEESGPAPAKADGTERMSEDDVERIARRVVQLISEDLIRNIAWEVVPEMAEMVVRDRIRQLESED